MGYRFLSVSWVLRVVISVVSVFWFLENLYYWLCSSFVPVDGLWVCWGFMGFVGSHMGSHIGFASWVSLYHWLCSSFVLLGGLWVGE